MAKKEIKVVAIKFNLEKESEQLYYKELMNLDDGTFSTPAGYAKAIVINHLKSRLHNIAQAPEINYVLMAEKVAELLKQNGEDTEIENIYDEVIGD